MRRLLLPFALLCLAVLGYTGYWFAIAHRLEAAIPSWAAARRAAGYEVRWQRISVEGFPSAFRLRVTAAALAGARPFAYQARAGELVLEAAPWNLARWRFTTPQGATLDVLGGGARLLADQASGTLATTRTTTTLLLAAQGLHGQGLAQGVAIAAAGLKLVLPRTPPASHLDAALTLGVDLRTLTLPVAAPSLGPTIAALALTAAVKGAVPPGPLDRALALWRDAGGTLELDDGRILWGPLAARIDGTFALDQALQPMGALTARIERPEAVVDAVVGSGHLPRRFAGLARALVGAMTKTGADGKPELRLPITLQDEAFFLGPVALFRLPRIDWPGGDAAAPMPASPR